MNEDRSFSKGFYKWTRELHLYFGLFICPYLVVFAVSTFLLNHAYQPDPKVETTNVPVQLTAGLKDAEQAKLILEQLNINGEVGGARTNPKTNKMSIGVTRPGLFIIVNVDLATSTATITRRENGFLGALIFLHKMPGPHNVKGPQEIFAKIWAALSDTTVYLLLFLTITGIYLWFMIKAERRAGWILLGTGCLSFVLIMFGLFSV